MTIFQFLSANGTTVNVEFTTDLIGYDQGSDNLTVCDIKNNSAVTEPNDAVTQGLLNTFTRELHSVTEMKKYAVDNNLTLKVRESGRNKAVVTANTAA